MDCNKQYKIFLIQILVLFLRVAIVTPDSNTKS